MGSTFGVGSPGTVGPASGGKIYGYTALTTLVTVAPANPSRRSIRFHNPGSVDILVSPTQKVTSITNPALTTFTPTTSLYGGSFRVYGNGGTLDIEGECQQAWQALTSDGTSGQLTVMDSNV